MWYEGVAVKIGEHVSGIRQVDSFCLSSLALHISSQLISVQLNNALHLKILKVYEVLTRMLEGMSPSRNT